MSAVACLSRTPRARDVLVWSIRNRRRCVRLGRYPGWSAPHRRYRAGARAKRWARYYCDHCGKPEPFCILCAECEALCCTSCGRVECVCDDEVDEVQS